MKWLLKIDKMKKINPIVITINFSVKAICFSIVAVVRPVILVFTSIKFEGNSTATSSRNQFEWGDDNNDMYSVGSTDPLAFNGVFS